MEVISVQQYFWLILHVPLVLFKLITKENNGEPNIIIEKQHAKRLGLRTIQYPI